DDLALPRPRRQASLIMTRQSKRPLPERVARAAEAALADQGHAGFVDVLLRLGWLDPNTAAAWRRGQIQGLHGALPTGPPRLAEAMRLFRRWPQTKGLSASPAAYVARTPQRPALRFSLSGDPAVEEQYRMHWMSPDLPEKKRERL